MWLAPVGWEKWLPRAFPLFKHFLTKTGVWTQGLSLLGLYSTTWIMPQPSLFFSLIKIDKKIPCAFFGYDNPKWLGKVASFHQHDVLPIFGTQLCLLDLLFMSVNVMDRVLDLSLACTPFLTSGHGVISIVSVLLMFPWPQPNDEWEKVCKYPSPLTSLLRLLWNMLYAISKVLSRTESQLLMIITHCLPFCPTSPLPLHLPLNPCFRVYFWGKPT